MLKVSLENIREMVEVDTIVGSPIKNLDDIVAIPVSKVKMTFASGGSDFANTKEQTPFGGGTGGSVSISPVAFLVISNGQIKVLHLQEDTHIAEKIIDNVPKVLGDMQNMLSGQKEI